jgi:hypothetical protein
MSNAPAPAPAPSYSYLKPAYRKPASNEPALGFSGLRFTHQPIRRIRLGWTRRLGSLVGLLNPRGWFWSLRQERYLWSEFTTGWRLELGPPTTQPVMASRYAPGQEIRGDG